MIGAWLAFIGHSPPPASVKEGGGKGEWEWEKRRKIAEWGEWADGESRRVRSGQQCVTINHTQREQEGERESVGRVRSGEGRGNREQGEQEGKSHDREV